MTAGPVAAAAPGLGPWLGLAKLRLNALVVFAVGGGFWLGSPAEVDLFLLAATVIGAGLSAVGGSALNQLFEREHDALMERTQGRPLPTGVLTDRQAAAFGCATSVVGLGLLFGFAGLLPAAISAFIVLSYLFVYTPLKRRTSLNTIVGAVTGALPPVLGWSAASGNLTAPAWTLFLIVFCWQIPHFLAIAVLHEADYARGGYRMLPGQDPELRTTGRQVVTWWAALLPASLLPVRTGVVGMNYGYAAVVLGLAFGVQCVLFAVKRNRGHARSVFLGSIVYLTSLWIALLWDKS